MKKAQKTRYCFYHETCDRAENCFEGEFCPVFLSNPDCHNIENPLSDSEVEEDLKSLFNAIYEGEEQ